MSELKKKRKLTGIEWLKMGKTSVTVKIICAKYKLVYFKHALDMNDFEYQTQKSLDDPLDDENYTWIRVRFAPERMQEIKTLMKDVDNQSHNSLN